ncbi:hypothetical protein PROFUN_12355 [Planoprotostelium fungivorum]|uniref:Nitroreductase domain-containing protein n=1 Tax=Planoprotostelium fungivorum TaxID=1890364 RepID=A0A2P6N9G3_9EUKA|nr:hypothetical protein PROFUN_12355 [Planoprotostelium fungivorum]
MARLSEYGEASRTFQVLWRKGKSTNTMSDNFFNAAKGRRSIYAIKKSSTISDNKIGEIVQDAVKYAPSAFNSQSARTVVLFGRHHDKLWEMTKESPEHYAQTEKRLDGFKAGHGTILFFEDMTVVRGFQEKFVKYQDQFLNWSQQANGMLQYMIWTALETEGLGCSLQHYNPSIDDQVKLEFQIPAEWSLVAQMPFGERGGEPNSKEFKPLEDRVKIFHD